MQDPGVVRHWEGNMGPREALHVPSPVQEVEAMIEGRVEREHVTQITMCGVEPSLDGALFAMLPPPIEVDDRHAGVEIGAGRQAPKQPLQERLEEPVRVDATTP